MSSKCTKYSDDAEYWYNDQGGYNRLDGPAVVYKGNKYWWVDDLRHREDGPAVENIDGTKKWYINGKLHRIDGPAVECSDGSKAWYINGKLYTEQQFKDWQELQKIIALGCKEANMNIDF